MILADTPRWPRHGMLWGHLISDSNLDELHEAAASLGLHPRSFDLDHYDWPESAVSTLERAGVRFVSGAELTRALIASGLRIAHKDRPAAKQARTREVLAAAGLEQQCAVGPWQVHVHDMVYGPRGHVDPLPHGSGWIRITRDGSRDARIQVSDLGSAREAGGLVRDFFVAAFGGASAVFQVLARVDDGGQASASLSPRER